MKKIFVLGAMLVSITALYAAEKGVDQVQPSVEKKVEKKIDKNRLEPLTVVPLAKKGDQTKHTAAEAMLRQKSKVEYVNEIKKEIDAIRALATSKKEAAGQVQYDLAMMKITVAEGWLKAIESYQDPKTRYVRSYNYAMSELKSARHDLTGQKFKRKSVAPERIKEILKKLAEQNELLTNEKKNVQLFAENDACYAAMLMSAYKYVELATNPVYAEHFSHLSRRANKYLKDGRKFIKLHSARKNRKKKDSATEMMPAATTATAAKALDVVTVGTTKGSAKS